MADASPSFCSIKIDCYKKPSIVTKQWHGSLCLKNNYIFPQPSSHPSIFSSMAARFPSPNSLIPKEHIKKLGRVPLQQPIRCFTADKVFEDQSMGIVCHTNEKGEVICEGYDEGPRFGGLAAQIVKQHRYKGYMPSRNSSLQIIKDFGFHMEDKKEDQSSLYWRLSKGSH